MPDNARAITSELVLVSEINVAPVLEELLLRICEKPHRQAFCVGGGEKVRLKPDCFQCPEPAPNRLGIDSEVHIGRIGLASDLQVLVNVIERMNRATLRTERRRVLVM